MTLVGYFNTIRDLGGVKALLGDDIPPRMTAIAISRGWKRRVLRSWEEELTGRIASNQVPKRLEALERTFDPAQPVAAIDVMACTNMISVGVDVQRLGLMFVDGQPKSTSEYIQATSRVGRRAPGLVVTVYNAMRPRDVSHYEHFFDYHDSYYRYVEAGTVAPFSDGAIARYLASAYVAAYRLSVDRSKNDAAGAERGDTARRAAVERTFLDRAGAFGEHEQSSVRANLDELSDYWSSAPTNLKYAFSGLPKAAGTAKRGNLTYLIAANDAPGLDRVQSYKSVARSMRNVEAQVSLRLDVDV
jgi:hypothetical protein